MLTKRQKSFTLIEMLVVVAIIAIITSLISISYSSSQKRARDTQRISDMNIIVGALNSYRREKGEFPNETIAGSVLGGWETSRDSVSGGDFLEYLKPYLGSASLDPKNKDEYYYAYRYYEAGYSKCNDENHHQPFYLLTVHKMEVDKNKYKERAVCVGYDWGDKFDYSIKIMK